MGHGVRVLCRATAASARGRRSPQCWRREQADWRTGGAPGCCRDMGGGSSAGVIVKADAPVVVETAATLMRHLRQGRDRQLAGVTGRSGHGGLCVGLVSQLSMDHGLAAAGRACVGEVSNRLCVRPAACRARVPSASHRGEGLVSVRRPRREAAGSAVRWRLSFCVVRGVCGRGYGCVRGGCWAGRAGWRSP